jgi:hypothetical protein
MYVSVVVFTLKPGKTYDDFLRAWYPEQASVPATFHTGTSIANKREVVAIGLHDTDMTRQELGQTLLKAASLETERNRRMAEVFEEVKPGNFFEVRDVYEISDQITLDAQRPT